MELRLDCSFSIGFSSLLYCRADLGSAIIIIIIIHLIKLFEYAKAIQSSTVSLLKVLSST